MEIRPASLTQIQIARGGQFIQIDDDVQGVANGLHEIDPHLRLRYSERGEYFVVYWKPDELGEGEGYAVFTAQDLDQRIVTRMREVHQKCLQPGYSFADELDRQEAQAKRETEYQLDQHLGELGEKLAHAMRHDLGYQQSSAFIAQGLPGARGA